MVEAAALMEQAHVAEPTHYQVAQDSADQEGAAERVNMVAKAAEWQKCWAACLEIKGVSVAAESWKMTVLLIHRDHW